MKQRRLDTDTDWDAQPTKQAKIADKDGAKPIKPQQRSSLGLQTLSDFESFQKANADKVNGAIQNRRRRFFKPEGEQTGSDSEGSNPIRRFDEELPNRGVEGLSDSNSQGDELQARYSTKKPVGSKPELLYLDWKAVGQKQLDPLPPVHVRASEVVLRPKVDGVLPEKIKPPTLVYEGISATTRSGYTHVIDQLEVSSTRRELLNSLMEQFVSFRCQQVTQATNKFLEETQFRESLKDHHLNVYNRNRELALQQVEGMVASMEESLDKTYTTIKTQFVPEICSHLDVTVPKLKNYEPDATFEEVTRGICASHKQNLQDQLRNIQEYGAAKEHRVKEMIRSIRDAHAKLDIKEKKLADSLSRGLNWTGGNTDPLKDLHKIATASFSTTIPDSDRDAAQVLDSY